MTQVSTVSNTYNFQGTQIELLIRKAYQRIGILGEFVTPQHLDSANINLNLLLTEWMNKSINLWTLKNAFLPLVTNQGAYNLPNTVQNITQFYLRTSANLAGTTTAQTNIPQSNSGSSYDSAGGGDAANAFDGNPLTACTQVFTNGNISYNYGWAVTPTPLQNQMTFLGIVSFITRTYSLVIEYANGDPSNPANWFNLFTIPAQSYPAGVTQWFNVITSLPASVYRIRETGGAILNISDIYFNNNVQDIMMSNISKYEYNTLPFKLQASRPNCWYYDRQANPIPNTVYIWPVPQLISEIPNIGFTTLYDVAVYVYKEVIQDVGQLYTNTLQIPAGFYHPLVWGLSWLSALEYAPDRAEALRIQYEKSFDIAAVENTEHTPVSISADYTGNVMGTY